MTWFLVLALGFVLGFEVGKSVKAGTFSRKQTMITVLVAVLTAAGIAAWLRR